MRIRTMAVAASILLSVNAGAQWLPAPPTGSGPIYYNGGNVGIGIDTPWTKLHVVGPTTNYGAAIFEDFLKDFGAGFGVLTVLDKTLPTTQYWTVGGNISLRGVFNASTGATATFGGIKAGKANTTDGNLDSYLALYTRGHAAGTTEKLRIDATGRVGIGTTAPTAKLHVVGDVVVTGNITGATVIGAVYQDLAEWVPSSDDLAPGTVVILDKRSGNTVTASQKAYDTLVAGVVSAQPGILLGVASATKEQIATTGRVKVRVDATKGPVEIGDLLVTSDVSGTAMKSAPIDIGGVAIHRPGTIIGKALEPLDGGFGEILVLLSLQ